MVVSQEITQEEIDELVREAKERIDIVKGQLESHRELFHTYIWMDSRLNNDQHLSSRLNTWIHRFDNYKVDPELIDLTGWESLDPQKVRKSKLIRLIEFLNVAEDSFSAEKICHSNDALLSALGDIINRFAMAGGFIPQQ